MLQKKLIFSIINNIRIDDSLTKDELEDFISYVIENRILYQFLEVFNISYLQDKNLSFSSYESLRRDYQFNYLKHFKEMIFISNILKKNNIDHVFLKGSALRLNTYDNPCKRYTRDIDILIDPSQLIEAYNLIKSLGFKYHSLECNDSAKGSLNYSRHLQKYKW